jgi:ABC-type transport system substrate-binding protein
MRKFKWLFFGYLALVGLIMAGIGLSMAEIPPSDPYTLRIAMLANIKTMDPAQIGDYDTDRITGNIFECLYNYEFGKMPYTLIPEIAESMPEISADGKTWIIHLKKGIHYYDATKQVWPDGVGPEIKAGDFIYSWKRACNFYLGLTYNYGAIFQGRIEGIDDWFAYTQTCKTPDSVDFSRPISGLTPLDDYTLQIKLTKPYPQLKFQLTLCGTAPVPLDAVKFYGDKLGQHPIGSGPYAMADYRPEQLLVFTANPIYRGGPNVKTGTALSPEARLPHVQRLEWDFFPEDLPRWYTFREGLLDANDIPKETYGQVISTGTGELTEDMKKDGIVLNKSPMPAMYYTGYNMADPVLGKNKPLRQAISMAYDRKTFIDIYLNGRGVPATGPIPPGLPSYDATQVNPYTQYDVEGAKAKLIEAEKINGGPIPPLTLYEGDAGTSARQDAEFFVSQMAKVGLTINVQYNTWARFQEIVDNKQEQLFDFGWVADYPDEQTFWQLFYSKNIEVGGVNSVNYANPEFDALYERASVIDSGPERDGLYRQMQQILLEDCPCAFSFYPVSYGLYHDWYKNPTPMDYGRGFGADRNIDFSSRAAWLKKQ